MMHPWLEAAIVLAIPMLALWLVSVRIRDVSIVDLFWGIGFVLVVVWSYVRAGSFDLKPTVLVVAVAVWGLRLSGYLAWRNWGKGEDRRYQNIRANYGASFWWISLFIVFGFQGALIWLVSWPVQWALAAGPAPMSPLNWAGVAIVAVGIAIETAADLQLARFKSDPASKGQVCASGLWRYSRHPNYFGDFVVWWGLFMAAYSGAAYLWTVVGPVAMSVMLLRVSGVALLEKDIAERRPMYADYVRRTSAFVPLPPRRVQESGS
jgi:steroid 5-alpha reductase family enzyme